MKLTGRIITLVSLLAAVSLSQAGNIGGKITLKGKAPANPDALSRMDPLCKNLHKGQTKAEVPFFRVSKDGGLGDVLVVIADAKAKSTGASAEPILIDQVNCMYEPYVTACQTSQKINVRNSDPLLHNVHPTPRVAGNDERNIAQPFKGKVDTFVFPKEEEFLRFKCDVHPWMFSYVSVIDHPYFAVSGEDGSFTIKNVPAGTYTVKVKHRKAGEKEMKVTVKGDVTANFELSAP